VINSLSICDRLGWEGRKSDLVAEALKLSEAAALEESTADI